MACVFLLEILLIVKALSSASRDKQLFIPISTLFMIGRQGKPDLPRAFMLTRANQRLSLVSFIRNIKYAAQMLNQVLPILNRSFICLSSDSEEKFFVLPKETCSDCERLKVFKEVLVSSEALKPKLDRCLKVTSSLGDIQSAFTVDFTFSCLL